MWRFHSAFFIALIFAVVFSPATASPPSEMLADVVDASPIIFTGKISAARKTDKFVTERKKNYFYYVFTIKIDTVLRGDKSLKKFDVMDFPGTAGCMDTSQTAKFLFFLSKSPYVAEGVTDWMVERQYKVVAGKITPTEFIDETGTQPLKTFLKKIGDIVRKKDEKKAAK
jgi:hypothetical protein